MAASKRTLCPPEPRSFRSNAPSRKSTAGARSGATSTPLPAQSPSALSTKGHETPSSAAIASREDSYTPSIFGVGMPCLCKNCFAKILLPSSCAARWDGATIGKPFAANASAIPRISGSSGPTTVKSGFTLVASSRMLGTLPRSAVTHSASSSMPAFPGAHQIRSTLGACASFHTSACSRPPPPITRIFIEETPTPHGCEDDSDAGEWCQLDALAIEIQRTDRRDFW